MWWRRWTSDVGWWSDWLCRVVSVFDEDLQKNRWVRLRKAGSAFSRMKKASTATGMSVRTKWKLFNCIITTVLFHVCETFKSLKEGETKFRRCERNCLRRIMKIKWYEYISDELRVRRGYQNVVERCRC